MLFRFLKLTQYKKKLYPFHKHYFYEIFVFAIYKCQCALNRYVDTGRERESEIEGEKKDCASKKSAVEILTITPIGMKNEPIAEKTT